MLIGLSAAGTRLVREGVSREGRGIGQRDRDRPCRSMLEIGRCSINIGKEIIMYWTLDGGQAGRQADVQEALHVCDITENNTTVQEH